MVFADSDHRLLSGNPSGCALGNQNCATNKTGGQAFDSSISNSSQAIQSQATRANVCLKTNEIKQESKAGRHYLLLPESLFICGEAEPRRYFLKCIAAGKAEPFRTSGGRAALYSVGFCFSTSSNLFSRARRRLGTSPSFLKTATARQKALTSNAGVPTSIAPGSTSFGTPLCG